MDRSDKKPSEFERRASRRLSRGVSVHIGADAPDSADDDAYLAAMAMTVSDGFRPPDAQSIGTAHATHGNARDDQRQSISKTPRNEVQPTATSAHDVAASATSADTYSSSSSSLSSSSLNPSSPSNSFRTTSSLPSDAQPLAQQLQESSSSPISAASGIYPLARPAAAARPSSIAKPPAGHFPRSVHSEGSSGGGSTRGVANIRASASSSTAPAHEEEPYQGPSGPSFPYQMYPQNVRMARTLSGVTTSTVAPSESSYTGPRGPTFPYSLYTQNTTVAGSNAVPVPGISVGFPGMADNYQRRIGPDGEDVADLIGPDGHTEQLPPYTRYPDEAYSGKIAAASAQPHQDPLLDPLADPTATRATAPNAVSPAALGAVPSASSNPTAAEPAQPVVQTPEPASAAARATVLPAPIQMIPGAGGLGLAPRNPEFDGVEEAESPRSRYSLRSFNSEGSGHEINTAARNISEKRKHRAPHFIQRYGGRRMLGIIPYWAICLVIAVLLLMAIVLGSVIGTFVARHKRAQLHHSNNGPVSVTVTVDATPIPTPTNLPALPTGTFGLPFQINESPGACFNDTTQAQAWKCSITNQYSMSLTINSLPPTPNGPMYDISINCNESATYENNEFFYGEQAPTITTRTPLQLVNDTLDLGRGPAWFKMLPYNKTVIVRESFLSVPNSQPTSAASTNNNNKRDEASDLTGSLSFGAAGHFGRKGAIPAQIGDKPWVCTWPDTILEIFIYPNQNTSMYKISLSSTYTPVTTTPTPTSSIPTYTGSTANGAAATNTDNTSTTAASSAPTQFSNSPPPYPRVVKMEERRMANSPQATCIQYHLKPEGTGLKAVPNLDANGQPIQIVISEIESGPSLFSQSKRDIMGADEMFEKRDESGLSKCGCLWMVT